MCYKEKLSQRASFYTESLLHSSFYTEQTFTWRSFTQIIIYCYTEKLLHRASFYTENMQNSNRNCSYKAESRRQLEKRTTWKHFWIEFKRKIISTKIEKPAAKTPFATLQMETIAQRQQRLKKSHLEALIPMAMQFDTNSTAKRRWPKPPRTRANFSPQLNLRLPIKHHVSCKSSHSNHITDVALNAIWAQRLAKHNRTATNNAKTHPTTLP